ncbi:MAG: VF530 family protein [Bacteroidia bacterium]
MTDKPVSQPNNPLHGITLKQMLEELHERVGWKVLDEQLKMNCFHENPSVNSSLKFLRKTEWARVKVEQFYLKLIQE